MVGATALPCPPNPTTHHALLLARQTERMHQSLVHPAHSSGHPSVYGKGNGSALPGIPHHPSYSPACPANLPHAPIMPSSDLSGVSIQSLPIMVTVYSSASSSSCQSRSAFIASQCLCHTHFADHLFHDGPIFDLSGLSDSSIHITKSSQSRIHRDSTKNTYSVAIIHHCYISHLLFDGTGII